MASMRDIKRRKSSIQSTQQITKAMKLVSTVKLQKSKRRAMDARDYFSYMYRTVQSMLAKAGTITHPYITPQEGGKKAVIMITANRGLAGGYNSNIIKLITRDDRFNKDNTKIYAVGKKGRDAMKRVGYSIEKDYSEVIEEPIYNDAIEITRDVLAAFEAGEIGEIYLAYTFFKNTVSHIPTLIKLLPVDMESSKPDTENSKKDENVIPMNFEPEEEEAEDQE